MRKQINKVLKFNLIFIFIIILYCKITISASPTFDDLPTIINLTEDALFTFYVNATDTDEQYPLLFSDDSETKMPVFNMVAFNTSNNNRKAIINFTPTEVDVLDSNSNLSNFHITIVVKDQTFATTAQDVLFNITNMNDPPNITSFTPASMTVAENSTITFSFDNNSADPDLTHPGADSINNIWYMNNTNVSTNISWSYSPGFCNSSQYNITLIVNDSYKNSTSIVQILTVTNLNRVPVNNATIQNLTWQEDNNLTNNFTLAGYFNDTDNAECSGLNRDTITYGYTSYGVTNSVNSSKSVTISIDQTTGNVSFYVEESWYGIQTIAFYANDSYSITYSNNITLNVTNINDAPVLALINNQTLTTNRLFTLQVNATDADNDTIYYYTNSTVIVINLTTGIINFTPTESNIGNHTINITVNDSLLQDSQIVLFTINNNTAPVLNPIGNQNATRNTLFTLNLTATDADGDNLTFTSNTTIFNIIWYNRSMSYINFTPSLSNVGNHSIIITVNDPYGANDSEIILFMINNTNRAPTLNTSIGNLTWRQNKNLTNNITLNNYFHDPDGDNLTYNVTGNTNITIIINQATSNVSFIPPSGWVGVEYIQFYVNDSYYVTYSNNITLNVTRNIAPVIDNIYPYGNATWGIVYDWANPSSYPNGTNISINEDTTETFRQNSTDANNDDLSYQWLLNSTLLNTTQNLTFYFNFTRAGMGNLTIEVSDGLNTTSFRWNINITNVNRPPTFGNKTYTTLSDFSGGTLNNTNITAQLGNITLQQFGSFYLNGTYISPSINTGAAANKINFTTISWVSNLPSGTNITLKTRTASTSAGLSSASWSIHYTNSTRSIINSTNNQFIQYTANLTTDDNTTTPILQSVTINYEINTPSLLEDYTYEGWIDLDNYFEDLDTDDTLVFNHSAVSNINIDIDQNDHTVRLSFDSNWYGTRIVQFWVNDSYSVAYSNNITIAVTDVTDETTTTTVTSGGGGGGGGATKTKVKKVSEYEYVELLVPGSVSIIDFNKIKIPITVENNIDQPLREIYLSATAKEGVTLEFDTSFINEIDINDKKIVNLFATSTDKNEPYIITINAKVITPSLNDSTIVQINPLENLTVKVNAVMDMLKLHPECLELNELVINAKNAINNKEYAKANTLLEEALSSCRFIMAKEKEVEAEKAFPKRNIWLWIIFTALIIIVVVSYYITKRKKSRIFARKGGSE